MFTRVEVRNFKSLRDVSVPLSNFHVLVGANGSGKSSFLDVFAFMGDLLNGGLQEALKKRNTNWKDLTFLGGSGIDGTRIWLAFEAIIPDDIRRNDKLQEFDAVRYECDFDPSSHTNDLKIIEKCFLFRSVDRPNGGYGKWYHVPEHFESQNAIWSEEYSAYELFSRNLTGNIIFRETMDLSKDEWGLDIATNAFALANIPEDILRFPITTWLKDQFKKFIQLINIESDAINKAGKAGRTGTVTPDGSNLPWLIDSLKKKYPDRYKWWLRHVQMEFPEIKSIKTVLREDQDDMFLIIKYKEGHEFKQWVLSDGTLRFLLLTIIPYELNLKGLFLIEEPEIGMHPKAIQAVMDSLRSVYEGQVFVTTHSPETVNCAMKKDLLLFL